MCGAGDGGHGPENADGRSGSGLRWLPGQTLVRGDWDGWGSKAVLSGVVVRMSAGLRVRGFVIGHGRTIPSSDFRARVTRCSFCDECTASRIWLRQVF